MTAVGIWGGCSMLSAVQCWKAAEASGFVERVLEAWPWQAPKDLMPLPEEEWLMWLVPEAVVESPDRAGLVVAWLPAC